MVTKEKHWVKTSHEGHEYAYLGLLARTSQNQNWGAWVKETQVLIDA